MEPATDKVELFKSPYSSPHPFVDNLEPKDQKGAADGKIIQLVTLGECIVFNSHKGQGKFSGIGKEFSNWYPSIIETPKFGKDVKIAAIAVGEALAKANIICTGDDKGENKPFIETILKLNDQLLEIIKIHGPDNDWWNPMGALVDPKAKEIKGQTPKRHPSAIDQWEATLSEIREIGKKLKGYEEKNEPAYREEVIDLLCKKFTISTFKHELQKYNGFWYGSRNTNYGTGCSTSETAIELKAAEKEGRMPNFDGENRLGNLLLEVKVRIIK